MSITITHTSGDGTLLDGTTRGDGTNTVLKTQGWRWGRGLGKWYVPQSRDAAPKLQIIEATVKALTEAQCTVHVQLDDMARTTAEVETDIAARATLRATRLQAKAERKVHEAHIAELALQSAQRRLPAAGEPIKTGHHSESRHLRAIDKATTAWQHSVEADHIAQEATEKAESAKHATGARNSPETTAHRLEKLTAQMRKIKRELDGYTANPATPYAHPVPPLAGEAKIRAYQQLSDLSEKIRYWERIQQEHVATGRIGNYNQGTISPGDHVLIGARWHQVLRANSKTVTVQATGSANKAPYSSIKDHRTPDKEPDQHDSNQ